MPVDADLQSQILYDLGMVLPTGPAWDVESTQLMSAIGVQLPFIWSLYQGMSNIPYRQFLYSKRQALDVLFGQLRMKRDGQLGSALRVQGSQLFKALTELRKNITQDIIDLEKRYKANSAPCVGQIIKTSPVMVPVPQTTYANVGGATVATTVNKPGLGQPDPGDPVYDGSDPRVRPPKMGP